MGIDNYDIDTLRNMVINSQQQMEKNPEIIQKVKEEITAIQRKYNIMKKGGFRVIMPRFAYEESDEWTHVLEDLADKEYKHSMKELKDQVVEREKQQEELITQYKHWKHMLRKKEKAKPDYVG